MILPLIGELNRRVTGYSVAHAGGSLVAALDRSTIQLFELWGKVSPVGSVSYYESVNLEQTITHRIFLRYIPGTSAPQDLAHLVEVECEGVWYRVRRVSDVNGQHRFTALDCEELGTDERA